MNLIDTVSQIRAIQIVETAGRYKFSFVLGSFCSVSINQDSTIGIVIRVQAWRLRNHGTIPGRGKRFSTLPKRT